VIIRVDSHLRIIDILMDIVFAGNGDAAKGEKCAEFVEWCANRLFQFAAIVKSNAFRFEQERRIVIKPQDVDYISQIMFIGGKPRLQPKFLSLKDCVNSLVVSPHGNLQKLKLTAKLLGLKLGRRISVLKSKSSYVG